MSKIIISKCSDNETGRLVKEIKNDTNEQEYRPYRGPERFMSLNHCGSISLKKK